MTAYRAKPPKGAMLDQADPSARGLLAAWLLDDGAGPAVQDATGRKRDGALVNAPAWGSTPFGKGLSFAASSSQYASGTGLALAGGPFTVAVLMLYTGSSSQQTLFSCGSVGGTRTALYLQLSPDTYQLIFGMYADDRTFGYPFDDHVAGTWYHFVFTMDSAFNERVYRNGKPSPSNPATAGGYFTGNGDWHIGVRADDGSSCLDSPLAGAWAWNRCLPDAEIRSLAADPFRMFRRGARAGSPFGASAGGGHPAARRLGLSTFCRPVEIGRSGTRVF